MAIAGPAQSGKTRLAEALVGHFGGRKIDSPRLPAADAAAATSGRALAWELELLAERGSRLARRTWPDEAALTVSDFWFDQSLAYGRLRLDAGAYIELRTRHQALAAAVVPPKLVVVLTPPQAVPRGLHRSAAGDADGPASTDRLPRLLDWLVGPGSGPVLELPADDWDRQWAELTAAVSAMS